MARPWKVIFSPESEHDLRSLYTKIAIDSPINAERFLDDLLRQIFELADLRSTGVSREWIRPGLRAFPYRKRCFYFRIENDTMIVLRVLHGAQDIDRQFPADQ